MKSGVKIFGGFDGSETVRSERDPSAHETVLSGDIGTAGEATDNVYHVVHAQGANNTALLDGFTVTGGRADSTAYNDRGGGLFAYFGWPMVVNVDFVDNYAKYGGGVFNSGTPIRIVNSGFFGNHATLFGGGFYGSSDQETLANCVFSGNTSAWQGGGAYFDPGSFGATLRNLTFAGNSSAGSTGGGLYIDNNQHLLAPWTVANVILWGNTSGGAANQLVVTGASPTTITYSLIQGGWGSEPSIRVGDPLFVDPDGADDELGTADDDLRLELASEGIDAGSNGSVPADSTDLDEDGDTSEALPLDPDYRDRFYDVLSKLDTGSGSAPIVDMGAYEAIDALDADLGIEIDNSFPDCVPGTPVSYWIEATNLAAEAVTGATVSDLFPAELSDCSWFCSGTGGASCTANGTGDINDSVDLPCGAPDNRALDGVDVYGTVLIEACESISARDTGIIGDATFRAGQSVVLGDQFHVDEGASFVAEIGMP
jgi:hypothetical protein